MNPIGNQKHNFDQKSQTKAAEGGQNAPNKIFSRVHVWVSKREQHISNSGKKSDTRIAVRRAPESQNCTKKKKKPSSKRFITPKEDPMLNFQIQKLKKCNSKVGLRRILLKLPSEWKKIIKFYMTECFIHDLYTRRLENKMFLLSKRELLYRLVDNPELLTMDCHFDNNLLKNYCTGIANFVTKHHKDIERILKIKI